MSKEDEKKLEAMLVAYETTYPAAGKNFRTMIGETPSLKTNLLDAIAKGNLEKLGPMPAGSPAGAMGTYSANDKAIFLPETLLAKTDKDPVLANTMRMIMTHESEHAINKQAMEKSHKDFITSLEAVAKGPAPHDYTAALKAKGDADRLREATDQVGGFNAVAAHVRKQNPTATPAQLNAKLFASSPEMEPYFDVGGKAPNLTYTPKAGLTLDKEGQLARTPANIEAMGKHFYDARPYQQIYGVNGLKVALAVEGMQQAKDAAADPKYVAPEVRFNLKELGLDKVGIVFGPGIKDTSPTVAPSTAPSKPVEGSHYLEMPRPAPETPLQKQAGAALDGLGAQGIADPVQRQAAAAAIAVKAQADGLERIDSIVASRDGKGLIAVQGDPTTDHAKTSYIDRNQAAQQPLEQSQKALHDCAHGHSHAPTAEPEKPQATAPSR
ncbi:MAG TPA: XVIPCD domain-containing protein [Xanthomonadaceae bacterium]